MSNNNSQSGLNSISSSTNPGGQNISNDALGFVQPLASSGSQPSNVLPKSGFASSAGQNSASDIVGSVSNFISNAADKSAEAADFIDKAKNRDIAGIAGKLGLNDAQALLNDVQVISGVFSAISGMFQSGDISITPPPISGGDDNSRSSGMLSAMRVDISAHPVELNFNTGIKPDAYTPEWMTSDGGYSIPYYCTSAGFQFPGGNTFADFRPTVTASDLLNTTNNEFEDLRSLIQRNVSFNVKSVLTVDEIRDCLNGLAYALQIYFSATRYIVASKQPTCRNEAIKALANSFTPQDEIDFSALRDELVSCPKPPRLVEMLYCLMQLYRSGEVSPKSPVLSINPFKLNSTTGFPDWSCLSAARTYLASQRDNWAIIGAAVPAWYLTGLPTAAPEPVHSYNWLNIFYNLPTGHADSLPSVHNFIVPTVASNSTQFYYNVTTDEVDGWSYGLTSVCTSGTTVTSSVYSPSLMAPLFQPLATTDYTNRYHWSIDKFIDSYYVAGAFFGRLETYNISSAGVAGSTATVPPGMQRLSGVTVQSITNTANRLIQYLIDARSLPTKDMKSKLSGGSIDPNRTGSKPSGKKPWKSRGKGGNNK